MRLSMIGSLVLLSCAPSFATPAKSKSANARGMTLMGKKQWAAAEAEFKTAVAEDSASVKAHYNLASAASRAQDRTTAISELVWVLDRAAWVAEARMAAKKIDADPDLQWVVGDWDPGGITAMSWLAKDARITLLDLVQRDDTSNNGRLLPDPKRAAGLAAASGPHDTKCDATDAKQGKVFELPLKLGLKTFARVTAVLASLKDGVAFVDAAGNVIARSEPLGCTGPGESQDQLATLSYAEGDPIDPGLDNVPTRDLQLFTVSYTNGGRREWQTRVVVFGRRDKALAKVFEGTLASSDTTGAGHLWQTPLGNLIYQGPGETKKQAFQWEPRKFTFVPVR